MFIVQKIAADDTDISDNAFVCVCVHAADGRGLIVPLSWNTLYGPPPDISMF